MGVKDLVLGDLATELDKTRVVLEAVPESHFDWRPHDKSWPIGGLANHISNLPMWATMVLTLPGLDLAAGPPRSEPPASLAAVLENFDRNRSGLEAAVASATDGSLAEEWTLRKGEHVIMKGPRAVVLRQAGLTHMAHHRGQLTIYLRLLDQPVPETYGPTADSAAPF
jgi:uncharacterized damage-inducible protein DinB